MRDVLRALLRHGNRRLVFIDGHYENATCLAEGIDLALRESGSSNIRILVFHWWEMISQSTIDTIFDEDFPGWALEHAAVVEISLMAAVKPALVHWERLADDRADRRVPYEIYPPLPDVIPRSGALSPARRASADYGRRILEEVVDCIAKAMQAEFGL